MNNKIIWVFGPSAVGKETFIKYVYNNRPIEILNRLGWQKRDIITCKESIDWVVQDENDDNRELRENLNKIIQKYSKNNSNSAILIKGQDLDFDNNHLNNVRESLPNDKHEIIFLYTNFNVLYNRYKGKKWWNESMTTDTCRNWIKKQIGFLKDHQKRGFQIRTLNSDDHKKYLDIDFPSI